MTVPQGYVEKFAHAEMTFKHQSTFDPATRREVCLEALPETSDFSTYPLIVFIQLIHDTSNSPNTSHLLEHFLFNPILYWFLPPTLCSRDCPYSPTEGTENFLALGWSQRPNL